MALPPGKSLNTTTRPDRYRHVKLEAAGVKFAEDFRAWALRWEINDKEVEFSRRKFRETELFDCSDGCECLRQLSEKEANRKIDRYMNTPLSEYPMPPELRAAIEALLKMKEEWIAGIGTPCLHCLFCRLKLYLLDKRPEEKVPMWCDAVSGEPHMRCTEMRHWAGSADVARCDSDSSDSDADEQDQRLEEDSNSDGGGGSRASGDS